MTEKSITSPTAGSPKYDYEFLVEENKRLHLRVRELEFFRSNIQREWDQQRVLIENTLHTVESRVESQLGTILEVIHKLSSTPCLLHSTLESKGTQEMSSVTVKSSTLSQYVSVNPERTVTSEKRSAKPAESVHTTKTTNVCNVTPPSKSMPSHSPSVKSEEAVGPRTNETIVESIMCTTKESTNVGLASSYHHTPHEDSTPPAAARAPTPMMKANGSATVTTSISSDSKGSGTVVTPPPNNNNVVQSVTGKVSSPTVSGNVPVSPGTVSHHQTPTSATLLASLSPLGLELADAMPSDPGVIVISVVTGSLAHNAGLQPGDLIRAVNEIAVTSRRAFREILEVECLRASTSFNVTVVNAELDEKEVSLPLIYESA